MSADDDHRQSDLAVMDSQEYKQKRRLKRILDAHEKVEEKADEAYELYVAGQINAEARNIMLLRAVRQFIREVYNLLVEQDAGREGGRTNGDEPATSYWQDVDLGTMRFEHREDVPFEGLSFLVQCPKAFTERWVEAVTRRHGPDEMQQRERRRVVPERIIWNGYLLCRQFLAEEYDLELQFEDMDDELPTWGFEEVHDDDIPDTSEVSANGDTGD